MERVKTHIESITNGNSKGLAYWIAIGVISMVLGFAKDIVVIAIDAHQKTSSDVYDVVQRQTETLNKIIYVLQDINHNVSDVEDKMKGVSNKMEDWRMEHP